MMRTKVPAARAGSRTTATPVPVILYPGEGIAQMLFWRVADACEVSYADRRGRYQDQRRVTPPFVRSTVREEDCSHG
jgi:deoxycytidine triphosphate deaminase